LLGKINAIIIAEASGDDWNINKIEIDQPD
jgi:hypothetical protein